MTEFKNSFISQWTKYLLISSVYGVAYFYFFQLSSNFELIPDTVSWYLPRGLGLLFFCSLAYRVWPLLYLAQLCAYVLLFDGGWLFGEQAIYHTSVIGSVCFFLLNPIMIMLPIYLFRQYFKFPYLASVNSTIWALMMFLALTIVWVVKWSIQKYLQGATYSLESLSNIAFSFVMGDLAGIIVVYPIGIFFVYLYKNRYTFDSQILTAFLVWGLFTTTLFAIGNDDLNYPFKVLSIIPAIYFSYRLGWQGAAISSFFVSLVAYAFTLSGQTVSYENLFYLVSLVMSCLFLGAAMSEQRALTTAINDSKEVLKVQLDRNRALSNHLVLVQEEERAKLSRDLHDDFGQKITDIKLKSVLGKTSTSNYLHYFDEIKETANELYQSIKSSIGQLRPSDLDSFGLIEALKSGDLAESVKTQNIKFDVQSNKDNISLTDEQSINIYRVCQEAINNSLKYAQASTIKISIQCDDVFSITISDNGIGFDAQNDNAGFGLISMRERALAIGANLEVTSSPQGTVVCLEYKNDK